MDKLPFPVRKAFNSDEEFKKEYLGNIARVIGGTATFEFQDIVTAYNAMKAKLALSNNDDPTLFSNYTVGQRGYLRGFAYHLDQMCKDNSVKEAILAKWTTKKIILVIEGNTHYPQVRFDNGDLIISVCSESIGQSADCFQHDEIEALL